MYLEENWKKSKQFPLDQQKVRNPRPLGQLPIFEKVD